MRTAETDSLGLAPGAIGLCAVNPLDMERFNAVVRQAFGQRRKRVGNALKDLEVPWQKVGVDPSLRAEQLDVDDFVRIANSYVARTAEIGEQDLE